ncbi:hypothetical protein GOV13_02950 [Candidatus Pacearchaeota archaeon]|nr:hypothetical protein [Candidatus Pacearchaeota archaeon]
MAQLFQIGVDLGFTIENNLERFKEFCSNVSLKKPPVCPISFPTIRGNYDLRSHVFYLTVNEDDAKTFAEKVLDTGLVNAVFIQMSQVRQFPLDNNYNQSSC